MKPYSAYKNSGIPWLDKIPNHWEGHPVKYHYNVQLGKMLQNVASNPSDQAVPYLKALHVLWGDVLVSDLPEMWASPSELYQYGVKNGDLLVCEGGEVGRAGILKNLPKDCIIQNALHRVRAKDSEALVDYLLYLLHAVEGFEWFNIICNKATIAHFTREKFTDLKIPVPPRHEQERIVTFLDSKTAQIDDLISKKEKMVELLKEELAATINRGVTRGLDLKVEVRNSGGLCLGNIPKHWKLKKLKYLAALKSQAAEESSSAKLCVDLENIEGWTGKIIEAGQAQKVEGAKCFLANDVLFAKLRPYLAKAYRATEPGVCGGEFLVLRPSALINSDFLFFNLVSERFIDVVNGATYGTKMPRASWDFIGNLRIPYPDKDEQTKIVEYLKSVFEKTDSALKRLLSGIAYLKEYRAALISDVVTGKIDVRGI